MVHGRTNCIIRGADDERGQLGGMAQAVVAGSRFRWRCVGCGRMLDVDLPEWLARCGPRYSMLNQIDVCPCGAPRFLMWSRGKGTPYLPLKFEGLWMVKEISLDPDAWYEIWWMEP